MKANKARFKRSIQLTPVQYNELKNTIEADSLVDGCKQGIAAVLYVLGTREKDQFSQEQLDQLVCDLETLFTMPGIMGKSFYGVDIINYMKNHYDIDVDTLPIKADPE